MGFEYTDLCQDVSHNTSIYKKRVLCNVYIWILVRKYVCNCLSTRDIRFKRYVYTVSRCTNVTVRIIISYTVSVPCKLLRCVRTGYVHGMSSELRITCRDNNELWVYTFMPSRDIYERNKLCNVSITDNIKSSRFNKFRCVRVSKQQCA